MAAFLMAFEVRWFGANQQNGLVGALQRAGMEGWRFRHAALIWAKWSHTWAIQFQLICI